MALFDEQIWGKQDKVQRAIDILKSFEPKEGYFLAFSGGKDSQCVYNLAKMAGVKFDAHYSVTGIDPPELIYFIRKNYPDVIWDHHYWNDGKPQHYFKNGKPKPMTMWGVIADHTIPPTRQVRYCCAALKESSGKGRIVVTGVRWAESQNRRKLHGIADIQTQSKKLHEQALTENPTATKINKSGGLSFLDDNDESRKMVEQCYQKNKTTINPIIDWEEEDVWEFIKEVAKVPYCELYDQGYDRLGCIGCPLQGREGMLADFERYPKYKNLYIMAFDRMIANHPGKIKVADGELAKPNGGGSYSESGLLGATDDGVSSQVVQVERDGSTCRSSGTGGSKTPDDGLLQGELNEASAEVVADSDSGREPILLDRQLLSNTHTHTHTATRNVYASISGSEPKSSPLGYGACGQTRTNPAQLLSSPKDAEQKGKDKKALKREIRERIADSVDVDAQIVPPPLHKTCTGERVLVWWLWMHRTARDWDTPNPI